jgi:capsular polysaccharide biosynthesis protein
LLISIHIIQLMLLGICIHAMFSPYQELNMGVAIVYGLTVELGILFIWRILFKIKNEYNNNNMFAICCLPCNNFIHTQRQLTRVYNINENNEST